MTPTSTQLDAKILALDLDAIRAAIDAADERARLLRRLLLVVIRLQVQLTTADRLPAPATDAAKGAVIAGHSGHSDQPMHA